jgi:hypothetical protein
MSITNRTLAQAIDESALFAVLDSATGTFTGATVVIGTEFMVQTGPTAGTQIPIRRGQSGTAALAHAATVGVQVGLSTDFTSNPVLATVFHDASLAGDGSAGDPLSVVGGTATVVVDVAGALDGDGSGGDPLAVRVDGTTIQVNGSNNLEVIGGGGTVHVATTGALDGDGSIGDPLTVLVDGVTIDVNGSNQLEVIGGATGDTLNVLTADPVSPVNDTAWISRTGTTAGSAVTLKCRIAGTTYEIAGITLS